MKLNWAVPSAPISRSQFGSIVSAPRARDEDRAGLAERHRVNHQRRGEGVEGRDHPGRREDALHLLAEGVGVLGRQNWRALQFGTAICPTDPVLASSVVTGKPAEEDLPAHDRQILSLDSGANDGLALPSVLAAVAFAGPMTAGQVAADVLWQVLGAGILGVLGGRAGMACASVRLAQALTDVSGAPENITARFQCPSARTSAASFREWAP